MEPDLDLKERNKFENDDGLGSNDEDEWTNGFLTFCSEKQLNSSQQQEMKN